MAGWKSLKLSELILDQQNYRTGAQSTQRLAIRAIIEDQKQKLINLADDLLEVGPSPGEPIWVTPDVDAKGMYTVLEGNRRIAALKLLEMPALADGTVVEDQFKALAKKYVEAPIRELEAKVFDSRDDALPWIRRRHMTAASGVGIQRWKWLAKGRADREHGEDAPRSLAVFEFLKEETEEWEEIAEKLDTKWSTVDRVLDGKPIREILGVTINPKNLTITFENGDAKTGKQLLLQILAEMASPEFKFSRVEHSTNIEEFLQGFLPYSVKSPPKSSAPPSPRAKPIPAAVPSVVVKPPQPRADPVKRSTLAPKTGTRLFPVNGVRLSAIYRECKKIEVKGNENAAALLLRVFIELSSEAFLVKKNAPIPQDAAKKGKLNWDDIGISLATKVGAVLALLDLSGKAKAFLQIRVNLDHHSTSPSSITTLHGYFHNRELKPEVEAVQGAWDVWEIYLSSLHKAM